MADELAIADISGSRRDGCEDEFVGDELGHPAMGSTRGASASERQLG